MRLEGIRAEVFASAEEYLDHSATTAPSCLVLDMQLPGMSGYALARELKERHGTLSPLLIAVSGVWTNTSDRLLGQTVGFDHYLVKPCDVTQVLGLIRDFHEESSGNFPKEAR